MISGDRTAEAVVMVASVDVEEPTTRRVCELLVSRATTVADVPEPMVMVAPGTKVRPETMYSEEATGVIVLPPTTMFGADAVGATVTGASVDVEEPTTRRVCELLVSRATTVVDAPEPMVIVDPGTKVWPETTYSEEAI